LLSSYISKLGIRSLKTGKTYLGALKVWSRTRGFEDPDAAIQKIKDENIDAYQVLQDFVNYLHGRHNAPKTILTYYGALKGFMIDSDIELTDNKLRAKIVLPEKYEISDDRAPTPDEVRSILLRSSLDAKAATLMQASSGMRIGELCSLTVGNVTFGEPGEPSRIAIKAAATKTRKRRVTFITPEATAVLKEHLGQRIKDPEAKIFQITQGAIYNKLMRIIKKAGLKTKSSKESARYELHPHCFRKYFHTNMLAAGVERGVVEGFEGHRFALDSAYLRATDAELRNYYMKGLDKLIFLSTETTAPLKDRMGQLESENKDLKGRLERLESISVERFVLAAATKKQGSRKKRKH
jgi:integrase/recombinase XerD